MSHAIVPIPQVPVSVRDATMADVPFIDALQKKHAKMVGFMANGQLLGKIKAGEVLIAEESGIRSQGSGDASGPSSLTPDSCLLTPVGYCIGTDRYFKHDDVGIIYQLNVAPGQQRGFVGATLLKAMFDRAAYGCRLFCCWCAQDIEANRFWEAMGFVPLAYRAGSEKKSRVHIFWQKRIRSGDSETPWWFPSQTTGGSIREDRLVLPIPPGVRWGDEMPVRVLPGGEGMALPPDVARASRPRLESKIAGGTPAPRGGKKVTRGPIARSRGLYFAPPRPPEPANAEKKPREKAAKRKNDPKLVAAARELRDRWLERVNAGEYMFEDAGKYDVSRALPGPEAGAIPLLHADARRRLPRHAA